MTKHKLLESMKALISNVNEQLVDTQDNYNMGLITFHEYMIQCNQIYSYYSIRVSNYVNVTMEEEQVSLDFLKGLLSHESIGV